MPRAMGAVGARLVTSKCEAQVNITYVYVYVR